MAIELSLDSVYINLRKEECFYFNICNINIIHSHVHNNTHVSMLGSSQLIVMYIKWPSSPVVDVLAV